MSRLNVSILFLLLFWILSTDASVPKLHQTEEASNHTTIATDVEKLENMLRSFTLALFQHIFQALLNSFLTYLDRIPWGSISAVLLVVFIFAVQCCNISHRAFHHRRTVASRINVRHGGPGRVEDDNEDRGQLVAGRSCRPITVDWKNSKDDGSDSDETFSVLCAHSDKESTCCPSDCDEVSVHELTVHTEDETLDNFNDQHRNSTRGNVNADDSFEGLRCCGQKRIQNIKMDQVSRTAEDIFMDSILRNENKYYSKYANNQKYAFDNIFSLHSPVWV